MELVWSIPFTLFSMACASFRVALEDLDLSFNAQLGASRATNRGTRTQI